MTGLSAGGRVRGRGLGQHIAKGATDTLAAELDIDAVPGGLSRGLISLTIEDQLRELEAGANTKRTRKPLYHVHCNPRWDDEELVALFWRLFEQEFGLTRARFASKKHKKGNRGDHTHRVYDITREDGSVIDMSNDYYRREKLMVIACFILGRSMPPVSHLRAIAKALKAEGKSDVLAWMGGQPPAPRAVSRRTPAERQADQRTGGDKGPVAEAVIRAWVASDTGAAFLAALQGAGLDLAHGDSAVMVVDERGAWPLTRLVGEASREMGQRIAAAAVHTRVRGLTLTSIAEARRAIQERARVARNVEVEKRAAAEADRREAARRRATVARVPREIEARAAAVRVALGAIRAETPTAPPNIVEAEAKLAKAAAALTAAEVAQAQTAGVVQALVSENGVPRPWWRRVIRWSTGEAAKGRAALQEARLRDVEAQKEVALRERLVTRAEVKCDIAVRAWKAEVAADRATRAEPLREELSLLIRSLGLLRRDPELALLPPDAFHQIVEDDPGEDQPTPQPR
jgi:hypothetical protein